MSVKVISILFDIYLCRLKLIHPQADSFTGEFNPRGVVSPAVPELRCARCRVISTEIKFRQEWSACHSPSKGRFHYLVRCPTHYLLWVEILTRAVIGALMRNWRPHMDRSEYHAG